MAEIIQFEEVLQARRIARGRVDRLHLERAVELLKINLAAAALQLKDAPPERQHEWLGRVEHLSALVRYGLGMLGA